MRIFLRFASIFFFLVPFLFGQALLGQTPLPVSTTPVSTTKDATIPPAKAVGGTPALVPQKVASAGAELPSSTPIVTLQGLCDRTTASKMPKTPARAAARTKSKSCQTVITKAQMDAMLDLLIPGASQEQRRAFALNYIRMLAASGVAQEKRLDHDPAVAKEMETRLQFTRMQVMASSLYRRVENLAEDVQDSEIQSYYTQQEPNFIQGDVQRITLSKAATSGTPVDLVMLKNKAEELRARAAKGEDFDQLEKEAVQAENPGGKVPWTKMATARRATLPPAEAVVFDLKPGEVTPVINTPGAFEILKLVSVKTTPLEALRANITTALTNGHLQLIMKDATKDVTANFNLVYLDLPKAPELFLSPTLRGPAKPGANAAGGRAGASAMAARDR